MFFAARRGSSGMIVAGLAAIAVLAIAPAGVQGADRMVVGEYFTMLG